MINPPFIPLACGLLLALGCRSQSSGIHRTSTRSEEIRSRVLETLPPTPESPEVRIETLAYADGFLTSEEDRIVMVGPEGKPETILAEDAEEPGEKPKAMWTPDRKRLVLTVARDAQVLLHRPSLGEVHIELKRRKEVAGRPPVGHLETALLENRTWTSDDLAAGVAQICGEPASREAFAPWMTLLGTDLTLETDTTLEKGIQAREIALACMEGMAGEAFYRPAEPGCVPREILARDSECFRVPEIDPADLPEIQATLEAWLEKLPH